MNTLAHDPGLLAIITALITLLGKIWNDSSKQTQRVMEVVEKNATAMTKLNASIEQNTEVTKKVGELTYNNTITNKSLAERINDFVIRQRN